MIALLFTAFFAVDDRPAMHASIDGDWTVICLEKNGQPMPDTKNITVHVKDNVVTFKTPDGAPEKDKVRALKIEFGRYGTIRTMEANADGKFEQINTAPNAVVPTATTSSPPTSKTGVYVLTHDYFAICVHDESGRARENAPAGTPQPQPGGATATGSSADIKPTAHSYCTVILKRAESRPNKP